MWILVNYTGKNMTSYMINVKLVKKKRTEVRFLVVLDSLDRIVY